MFLRSLGFTWRKVATHIQASIPVTGFKKTVKVAFSDKYLLLTNITISVSLSALGDCIEQRYELYFEDQEKYDPSRTKHMAFSGGTVGILCHFWYKTLDKFIIGKSLRMVTKKLVLDQFIFSPIAITTFFASASIFEDNPYENFIEEVRGKFLTLYKAEWMVWPPAQVINFYFLPTKYRVLYDNTISLGYDIYTSRVKHKSVTSISENYLT